MDSVFTTILLFIVLEYWILIVNHRSVVKKYSALIDPAIAVVEAD